MVKCNNENVKLPQCTADDINENKYLKSILCAMFYD